MVSRNKTLQTGIFPNCHIFPTSPGKKFVARKANYVLFPEIIILPPNLPSTFNLHKVDTNALSILSFVCISTLLYMT